MKKVLALALSLIMVLSMGTMAFAAETTTAAATAEEPIKVCPICENEFRDAAAYNAHIAICKDTDEGVNTNITIQEIIAAMIELLKAAPALDFSVIENIIVKLIDFVQNIGTAAVAEADVKGAVADLEAALAGIEIPGIDGLLTQLKQQIKNLYAGEVATTVEATTAAEEIVDTGSSSVGIAVFAAVSVAAAAAYVCTKKSK